MDFADPVIPPLILILTGVICLGASLIKTQWFEIHLKSSWLLTVMSVLLILIGLLTFLESTHYL
jgi:hypothetical membrane protein